MWEIWHNPRCGKSRAALAYLEEQGVDFKTRLYLQDIPTKAEISQVVKLLNIKPADLIRKGETIYKENYAQQTLSDDDALNAMAENPILIERPIVIHNQKAAIGRPLENVMELVKNK